MRVARHQAHCLASQSSATVPFSWANAAVASAAARGFSLATSAIANRRIIAERSFIALRVCLEPILTRIRVPGCKGQKPNYSR